jgi:LSD1 subclass zinc finger protein
MRALLLLLRPAHAVRCALLLTVAALACCAPSALAAPGPAPRATPATADLPSPLRSTPRTASW